jgi:hypothetical protein
MNDKNKTHTFNNFSIYSYWFLTKQFQIRIEIMS